jgi:polyphosphate kinase
LQDFAVARSLLIFFGTEPQVFCRRYVEHARVFYFHNDGNPTFWLASADWMPRNFNRRIEIAFPVVETLLQVRLKEILEHQLADTVKGWWMQADGSYVRNPQEKDAVRFQEYYYERLQVEKGPAGSSKSMASSSTATFQAEY